MPHSHPPPNLAGRRLALSLALTLAFVVGELLAGVWSHSIALMSDAGHNLADALALLLSWYGVRAAMWPSSPARTFGYHRVGVLAALANAASLLLIAGFIIWGAAQRLVNPQPVAGPAMIWVAVIAIVLNGLIALWLHRSAKNDLNIRSAYIHMLGDAFAAVGVVIAGVIITLSGKPMADPICSLIIGGLILWTSWGILTESVNVLLEGTPASVDMAAVEKMIAAVPGVLGVHDLHVWSLGSGVVACSCHILVAEQSIREGQQVLRAVTNELDHHFHITHTTVQVEVEGCDPDDMYCTLKHSAGHEHDHSHSHAHHGH